MNLLNLFKHKKQKSLKDQIIEAYYQDYPEIPYISDQREPDWKEHATMFPQMLVKREVMIRFDDGLLPGHVYMLYWIDKYGKTNKTIPRYFEFDYGIDFQKERKFLIEKGYLDKNLNLTPQGQEIISKHIEVIEERHPKPKITGNINDGSIVFSNCGRVIPSSIPDGIYEVPDSDQQILKSELKEINQAVKKALQLAKIKTKLSISLNSINFNCKETCYELKTCTPSGKKSKYPICFHYSYIDHSNVVEAATDYFGEINYLKDGLIGDARLIFWQNKNGFMIKIRTKKDKTFIKSVETVNAIKDGQWIKRYICN